MDNIIDHQEDTLLSKAGLTPNSYVVVKTSKGHAQCFFYASGTGVCYWAPSVSASNPSVSLSANTGNGIVTFEAGLTVSYSEGVKGHFTVLLNGKIKDNLSEYKFTGKSIGTGPC